MCTYATISTLSNRVGQLDSLYGTIYMTWLYNGVATRITERHLDKNKGKNRSPKLFCIFRRAIHTAVAGDSDITSTGTAMTNGAWTV